MIYNDQAALLYHKVTPEWEVGVTWVTPSLFRRQMRKLADNDWKTYLPESGSDLKDRSDRKFILVFDDAYECIYKYAFPVLEELGCKAFVFVPGNYIGGWNNWDHQLLGRRFRHMNLGMIKELKSAGWTIGAHSASHCDLTGLGDSGLKREICESKHVLEELIGSGIDCFSFPFGRYNDRTIEICQESGFKCAFTPVDKGIGDKAGIDLIKIDAVYRWNTPGQVLDLVGGRGGQAVRGLAHRLNSGTIIWRKLFKR